MRLFIHCLHHTVAANFGAEHLIHHFVVGQPFWVRHLVRHAAWKALEAHGVRVNDWGVISRANRYGAYPIAAGSEAATAVTDAAAAVSSAPASETKKDL
jgi:hypothetical protein